MRLEDSFLYVIIEKVPAMGLEPFCEEMVAGGVDVIHLGTRMAARAHVVGNVCKRCDALLIIAEDTRAVLAAGADGLHLGDATAPVGPYRAALGPKSLIGVSTHNTDEAILALEMGADFLLHWAGTRSGSEFASLPGAAGNALFAAGLKSLEEARRLVEGGTYRLCIHADLLEEGNVTENAAAFSRILGRSI